MCTQKMIILKIDQFSLNNFISNLFDLRDTQMQIASS